ncbi:hypothetical protein [Xanthobacter tagetidis]|uniref:IS110 family transposase n=1 Tax=Xanthobacter tagetidis TaxID=60216 RepID=A0A3L7ALR2_9HYPH|nr:hypothetical protein [Xanthobacter tagetidis]MBB6308952.1 hypothetical protein [Xanthobacter tagetidis]RLP80541.1 hypothetical protein D9R14_05695 [Xanthobacter tagetidis]
MPADLIATLMELQARRKFHISLANKNTNAAGALVRRALGWRYDDPQKEKVNKRAAGLLAAALAGKPPKPEDAAVMAAVEADLQLIAHAVGLYGRARHEVEMEMARAVRRLPIHPFAKAVKGLGDLGLAVIIGEAGDIGAYAHEDPLHKRLGLMTFEGKAFSTWRREGGLSAEDWTRAGYAPRRRAEMFAVIGEPLFRAQSVAKGPYRAIYDTRRARTAETRPDWTKGHSHHDALRVMTKALISDLRSAWRRDGDCAPARDRRSAPASTIGSAEAAA